METGKGTLMLVPPSTPESDAIWVSIQLDPFTSAGTGLEHVRQAVKDLYADTQGAGESQLLSCLQAIDNAAFFLTAARGHVAKAQS